MQEQSVTNSTSSKATKKSRLRPNNRCNLNVSDTGTSTAGSRGEKMKNRPKGPSANTADDRPHNNVSTVINKPVKVKTKDWDSCMVNKSSKGFCNFHCNSFALFSVQQHQKHLAKSQRNVLLFTVRATLSIASSRPS